jgi:hypothetical protein
VCDVHHVSCSAEARDVVAWDLSMCGQREEEISRDGGHEMKGEAYEEMGSSSLSMITRTSRESTSVRPRAAMVGTGVRC